MLVLLSLLSSFVLIEEESKDGAVGRGELALNTELARGNFYADNFLGFMPTVLELSADPPALVKTAPPLVGTARYGSAVFGNGPHAITVILFDDDARKVYLDANQDGDLTNDPEAKWESIEESEQGVGLSGDFEFNGSWRSASGDTTSGKYRIALYRPAGSDRAFYYARSGRSGKVTIDGKEYTAALIDNGGPTGGHALFGGPGADGQPSTAPTLLLDIDADGTFRSLGHAEAFSTNGERATPIGDQWLLFDVTEFGAQVRVKRGEVPLEVKYKQPMVKVGDLAPGFDMLTPDGTKSSLADRKGKVVLVDFWATWCGPCVKAMPLVQQMHEKTKGRTDFEIIGLCVGDEREAFDKWLAANREKFTFTIGFDPIGRKVDPNAQMMRWGISAIPFGVVIDREGRIVEVVTGYTPENEQKLKDALQKLGVDVG